MLTKWILLFAVSSSAFAYNLTTDFKNGFYWATLPINITVVDGNETRKNLLTTIAKKAITEWEQESGLSLWDFTEAGTPNVIRWSDRFEQETKMDPMSVLAVAIRYTEGPYFAKTEIVINGNHFLNQSVEHLYTTITHELGHTMGLDHSDDMLAVMAPTLQDPYNGLQTDDLEGLREVESQTEHRQTTRYVSPLAYEKEAKASPLSCGTVGPAGASSANTFLSLGAGLLIGFVRKLFRWLKSLR